MDGSSSALVGLGPRPVGRLPDAAQHEPCMRSPLGRTLRPVIHSNEEEKEHRHTCPEMEHFTLRKSLTSNCLYHDAYDAYITCIDV